MILRAIAAVVARWRSQFLIGDQVAIRKNVDRIF